MNFVSFASSNMNKTKFAFVLFLHKFERNSFRADEKGISNSCTYPKHDKWAVFLMLHLLVLTYCPLFVLKSSLSNAICILVLWSFREGINISFMKDGTIPSQHFLKTAVEVHSSTLHSTRSWMPSPLGGSPITP